MWSRRKTLIGVGAGVLGRASRAKGAPPNGAAALIVTAAGLRGVVLPATLDRQLTPLARDLPYAGGWLREGWALTHKGSTFSGSRPPSSNATAVAPSQRSPTGRAVGERTLAALLARLRQAASLIARRKASP